MVLKLSILKKFSRTLVKFDLIDKYTNRIDRIYKQNKFSYYNCKEYIERFYENKWFPEQQGKK